MTDNANPELHELKERADLMGIKYSPNIGVDKLREKVNAQLAPKQEAAPVPTPSQYVAKRNAATKLLRIQVQVINPAKKESHGEPVRLANNLFNISRFVPFEQVTHLEAAAVKHLQSRLYATVVHEKDKEGRLHPVRRMRKEFNIEILDPLSKEELATLAAEQSARKKV